MNVYPKIRLKQLSLSGNLSDEYLRMQIAELGKRVEEFKKEQTNSTKAFNDLKYEITQYKRRQDSRDKERELDFVRYGSTVWTKSSGKGPFVTLNRVALKIETNNGSRTVMGWICKNKKGGYTEIAEEDLSTKFQKAEVEYADLDSDWPILLVVAVSFLIPTLMVGCLALFL